MGIACANADEHHFLRKYWNTYGLFVVEDVTFPQPHPARTTDFISFLERPHSLSFSQLKEEHIQWTPDVTSDTT